MRVEMAFHRRGVASEHGRWGNDIIEVLLERHPWLSALVTELQAETDWSWSHSDGADGWMAVFFEDKVGDQTTISLEMRPSRHTLKVPSLTLQADPLVTLRDVERWIISGIHRAR